MEHIKKTKVESVLLLDQTNNKRNSQGNLYLTATHLIFIDSVLKKEIWILHMHICSVEKLPLSTQGSPLSLKCKNFLSVIFVIPHDSDCNDIYSTLLQLSQPVLIEDLYCFHYTSSSDQAPMSKGWNFYNAKKEFARQGVPSNTWTHTAINAIYEVCDTYPPDLYVPISAPMKVLLSSAKFRSKGRFPVLTFLHKNQAALCRCSQPLSGFNSRCIEDERLLECIVKSNPNSTQMFVVDTRPKINAMANRAAGKGYENESFYENIKFHFSGIENIHVMRASLNKLIETCQTVTPTMNNFLNGLESCGWLKHVRAVLETGKFIATEILAGTSVLVHCSDGWDRTAQTCALAQLLLDPYYRTMDGFQILIEKEWLSFGHKFSDRYGHLQGDSKEVSPIFTQFLDCVYQLTVQYPSAFEFNERYLLNIHDHVCSAQFGTFIGNCHKERVELGLSERTYSVWAFLASQKNQHKNPIYSKDAEPDAISPNVCPQNIRFWRGLYNRFENGVHPREPLWDTLAATMEHHSALTDHVDFLTKRVTWLRDQVKGSKEGRTSIVIENCSIDDNKRPSPTSTVALTPLLSNLALDWKSFRNLKECSCSTPFHYFSRKFHCWRCGEVYCTRCIDKNTPLPGHSSGTSAPVCHSCYKEVTRSLSVDTP